MPWVSISSGDIERGFAAAELNALRSIQTSAGGDPTDGIVAAVVEEVRGYVAGCGRNNLGPAGTIPARLLGAALDVLRWRMLSRLPVQSFASEARRTAYEDAISLLRSVSKCDFAVDQPEAISAAPGDMPGSVAPVVRPRPPRAPL